MRAILAATAGYARRDARFLLAAALVLSAPQVLADTLLPTLDATAIAFVLALVALYVQLLVTFRALDDAGAAPPGYTPARLTEGRFATVFAASFVSGCATLVGLVLLVVPGVALFLLWILTIPVIAAERAGASEALRRSWRLVRPRPWLVARLALVVVGAIAAAGLVSLGFDRLPDRAGAIGFSLWLNLSISAIQLFAAALWTRAYLAVRAPA